MVKTRVAVLLALLLAVAGPAGAQSPDANDGLDELLPDQVAGSPMYRVPAETGASLVTGLGSDFEALLTLYGVDVGGLPMAVWTDHDLQPLFDARAAGKEFTDGQTAVANSFQIRGLVGVAMLLGEQVDVDGLIDAMAASNPSVPFTELSIPDRRVLVADVSLGPLQSEGWLVFESHDGVLYLIVSFDDEPSPLETLAALP